MGTFIEHPNSDMVGKSTRSDPAYSGQRDTRVPNTHSDAELLKKFKKLLLEVRFTKHIDDGVEELEALFQAETDRLLHEVIEQAVPLIEARVDGEDWGVDAVPVSVLNTYLRGGNHGG